LTGVIKPKLWAELQTLAAAELRRVNGQIEYMLGQAVRARRGKREDEPPTGDGGTSSPDE
jgi:hypothetical protein